MYKTPNSRIKSSSFKSSNVKQSQIGSSKGQLSPSRRSVDQKQKQIYDVRFKRKDLRQFNPRFYVTANIKQEDVLDLKEVFDYYASTATGVLLPNDLKLLLSQNGFIPSKKTVYQIIAEFDLQETGGISFFQFMKAMDSKPFQKQKKKDIFNIFKKYDRSNKGFIDIADLRQMNRHLKENLDDQTLKIMIQRASQNNKGKIMFEDFYSVMIKNAF